MKPLKIHLQSRDSHLKGNWYVWSCTAEMPDGSEVEGFVEADGQGEMISEESFEEC